MEKFNDRLKQLREEVDISMNELAKSIGVSNAAICKWEQGIAEPKVTYLIKLSEYFDCTIDYLIGKTNEFQFSSQNENAQPLKLSEKEKSLIEMYRELTPNLKELLIKTVKTWTNF